MMTYTYSPNWYKPQCLHFSGEWLLYCSNYMLYEYSLQRRRVEREKCFRQLAVEYALNHKDIKITAIHSNPATLFVGLNQPFLVLLNRHSLEVEAVVPIDGFDSIEYLYAFQEEGMESVLVCSREGSMASYCLGKEQGALRRVEARHKLSAVKGIFAIDNHHCLVFTRGTILIYNCDFSVLEKVVEVSSGDTVYSVDCLREEDRVYFAFLTKNKDSHTVVTFQFCFKQEFPLEHKKKLPEIAEHIHRFDVAFHYPKKFTDKLKQNLKASLTLKLLSRDQVVVTGKLGEVVTVRSAAIQEGGTVSVKPYSLQEEEAREYEVWPDSRHYKEIYFIYRHQDRLYVVSTDHNLSVWQPHPNNALPKYLYTLKFLTAAVQAFFYSESDPRNVFALLRDSAVRSFTPLEEGSHQLNEYWKFSKKFKIKKAVCHPTEQGVLALVTECNHLQLYDVYEDRLMKLIDFAEEVAAVSFELPCVRGALERLGKAEAKEEKLKTVSHFQREMEGKTVMLVQTKTKLVVVEALAEKEPRFLVLPKGRRLERVHENRYWDGRLLVSSQNKNNVLEVLMLSGERLLTLQVPLKYQQGRVLFKVPRHSQQLALINFKGSKFTIFRTTLPAQGDLCEVESTSEVLLTTPIDYLFINYSDWRVAVYGQREDSLLVAQLDLLTEDRYEITKSSEVAQLYWLDAKLDSLMLYLDHHLIVATKDQTIKLIDYPLLPQQRPPRRKGAQLTRAE